MKKLFRRPLSMVLSVLMVFSAFSFAITGADVNAVTLQTEQTESSASANPYGLTEKISEGAILHAWCWSFNTIKENLSKIAEAGFTSVQTSPINQCKVGDNGGMELMGNGKWYYHYQPTLYTIGNYQLGTLEEFKSMCAEAETYGIKIIVDVVANHCSSDYNAISSEIKNLEGGAFHSGFGISDYNNRYQCTQGQLLSLYDLNTQNTNVQQMILNYLKECVAAGADGFRYDAAKHIELPDDYTEGEPEFAGNFWPVVLNNGSEFQYGEILQDTGSRTAAYSQYMSVTASSYGSVIREAVKNGNLNASNLTDYRSDGAPTEKLVTWVESHDNYTGDGTWSQLDSQDIRQAWAIISARGDTTPLFFNRPDGSSTSNQWGKNQIGIAGDDNYCHPEVTAVNQFRNAMVGLPNELSNPTGDNKVLMIERGSAGAVIINASNNDLTLDFATNVADGSYTDEATGAPVTVSGGKLSGTVKAGAIAVIYSSELVKQPTVSISQSGGQFRDTLTLTLTARNTTEATYQIGSNAPVKFVSGDTITIGADMAENTSVDITLYGKNADGETSKTYTFTKISTPVLAGKTVVYFDNSDYNWNDVYLYAYYDNGSVKNAAWPGVEMTDLGGGIYGYAIDESWSLAYVIFNNGSGTQFPSEVGYEIKKGESKIFNGSGLEDYISDTPPTTTVPATTAPTTVPPTTVPTTVPPTTQPVSGQTVVYFDNSNYNWNDVYVYAYYNNGEKENSSWPGVKMTDLGNGLYSYVIDESWTSANVLFNNNNGTQFPGEKEPGYVINKGESKIFNGSGLVDYTAELPTEPPVQKILGDVDGNGELNIKDAACVQLQLAKLYSDFYDESVADINGDGEINIKDAAYIQLKLAKLV